MTEYYDSSLEEILPPFFRKSPEVQSISYALRQQIRKLYLYMGRVQVYTAIDDLEDEMLDLLALELGSQYYSEDMDSDAKKGVIRNTLLWYMKAGTVTAVQELIDTVFGSGKVIENYTIKGGEAGTFLITITGDATEEAMEEARTRIRNVKNVRSHFAGFCLIRSLSGTAVSGGRIFSHVTTSMKIREDGQ